MRINCAVKWKETVSSQKRSPDFLLPKSTRWGLVKLAASYRFAKHKIVPLGNNWRVWRTMSCRQVVIKHKLSKDWNMNWPCSAKRIAPGSSICKNNWPTNRISVTNLQEISGFARGNFNRLSIIRKIKLMLSCKNMTPISELNKERQINWKETSWPDQHAYQIYKVPMILFRKRTLKWSKKYSDCRPY